MRVSAKLLAVAVFAGMLATTVVAAQTPRARPKYDFGASGIFLDTISGTFLGNRPKWARQPTFDEFVKALGGKTPKDFGLSFSCAVERSGSLRDCHAIFADPDGTDGPALTRAIASILRVDKGDAQIAVDKEYRLTVNAALQTLNSDGMPVECLRPMCIPEVLPPPPPPPQARDPLVRERMKAANDCFSSTWDKSTDLRFAADKAVRENQLQPPPEPVRRAVLQYVNSRTELKKCMAMLQETAHLATISPADRKAVDGLLESMSFNYSGQTRFEVAILIGFMDKQIGEQQLSFPGDWP